MLEKLKDVILPFLENQHINITKKTILRTELGLNSFDFVELVCATEEAFDIEIPDKKIKEFVTVEDVLEYIESKSK